MLQCPGKGIKGHKVYLRDDRKESDQLKLCEVEAFGYRDDEGEIQAYISNFLRQKLRIQMVPFQTRLLPARRFRFAMGRPW